MELIEAFAQTLSLREIDLHLRDVIRFKLLHGLATLDDLRLLVEVEEELEGMGHVFQAAA